MFVFARVLGVDEFGIYSYVWGWLGMAIVCARFGFDTMVLRFVASYSSEGDWVRARGVLDYGLRMTLLTSSAGLLLFVFAAMFQGATSGEHVAMVFLAAAFVLPVSVRSSMFQSAIRALKRPGLADVPEMIVRPLVAASLAAAWFWLVGENPDARTAMLGQLCGTALALGVAIFVWRRLALIDGGCESDAGQRREWLSVSLPLMLISAFQFALHQMDIVMIGVLCGPEEVGAYVPASRIADLVGFGLVVVSSMVAPMIASIYTRRDTKALQTVVRLATRMAGTFALVVFVVVVGLRHWLLGLFGDGFAAGRNTRRRPGARAAGQRADRSCRVPDDDDRSSCCSGPCRGRQRLSESGPEPRADSLAGDHGCGNRHGPPHSPRRTCSWACTCGKICGSIRQFSVNELMRVLMIIGSLQTGGAERQFSQLAAGLARRGHEVRMCTLFPVGSSGTCYDPRRASNSRRWHDVARKANWEPPARCCWHHCVPGNWCGMRRSCTARCR